MQLAGATSHASCRLKEVFPVRDENMNREIDRRAFVKGAALATGAIATGALAGCASGAPSNSGGTQLTGFGSPSQEIFLESLAEATSAVADHMRENIIYIDVMNNLSVDCDCDSHPPDTLQPHYFFREDSILATMSCAAPQCEHAEEPEPLLEQPSHLSPQSHIPRLNSLRTAHTVQARTTSTMTTVAGVNVIS